MTVWFPNDAERALTLFVGGGSSKSHFRLPVTKSACLGTLGRTKGRKHFEANPVFGPPAGHTDVPMRQWPRGCSYWPNSDFTPDEAYLTGFECFTVAPRFACFPPIFERGTPNGSTGWLHLG
jgi:hypothetical protein